MIWLIGFGGAFGAGIRFWLGGLLNEKLTFPVGTWFVNSTGSFLLGWLAGLYSAGQISEAFWLAGGVGFCGAYTTFSTFGYETITLIQSGQVKRAAVYVIASVGVGCVLAAAGVFVANIL